MPQFTKKYRKLDSTRSGIRLDGLTTLLGYSNLLLVKNMQHNIVVALILGLLTLSSTTTVWSCSAMGQNKHMGLLLDVSKSSNIFTIQDVESNSPITFLADDMIIDRLEDVRGHIIVDFEIEGSDLRATEINF